MCTEGLRGGSTSCDECDMDRALCTIVDAIWYVPNVAIQKDLQTPTVKDEIHQYGSQYSALHSVHRNVLVLNLMAQPHNNRRMRRHIPNDPPTRLLMQVSYL
jgi:hypothetical protein